MNRKTATLRQEVREFRESLRARVNYQSNITALSHQISAFTDHLLRTLFVQHRLQEGHPCALIAAGSYGRQELQLYSDADFFLLHAEHPDPVFLERAGRFIQDCWDAELLPAAQITDISACTQLASEDITVVSSLLDMRLVCGRAFLVEDLRYALHPHNIWPGASFYEAKRKEQLARYQKYNETAYNLEPDIKFGPGGLRDLQLVLAIGKRYFGMHSLADGIAAGYFSAREYQALLDCQRFLQKVRFLLHALANGREERLLFDYQIPLAAKSGFCDTPESLGIEQFMKHYFTVIKQSRELGEVILQGFEENHLKPGVMRLQPLDGSFQLANGYIEVRHAAIFHENPCNLLRLFLWLAKRPDIRGIRAETIRLVNNNLYRIDAHFRASGQATAMFMDILRTAADPADILQRMHTLGVLGRYLPAFGAITGQMQYDLFHIYTVDQHSLFVLRNVVRFLDEEAGKQFPLCHTRIKALQKREILYLAALFHDIGKGRGGDHSGIGADEAQQFALRHHLDADERTRLVWLVRHHLLMSHTAQRQDIYDPKTIERFCRLLPTPEYLDCLYLLTVADICATNPTLWNTWKDSLLRELYQSACRIMIPQTTGAEGIADPVRHRKERALQILAGDSPDRVQETRALWKQFPEKYFLHESGESLAHHARVILSHEGFPVVTLLPHHSQGGTQVLIYAPHCDKRFTMTTTILANQHVTIQEAAILTCDNQFDLDTYVILDEKNRIITEPERMLAIQRALFTGLAITPDKPVPRVSHRRIQRDQAHFRVTPQVMFWDEGPGRPGRMFLTARDRPGLLAALGHIFDTAGVILHNAKISTAGEKAEDTFYLSDQENNPLSPERRELLRQKIVEALS